MGAKEEKKQGKKDILHSIPGIYVPPEWYFFIIFCTGNILLFHWEVIAEEI